MDHIVCRNYLPWPRPQKNRHLLSRIFEGHGDYLLGGRQGQTFLWKLQGLRIPDLLSQPFPAHMGLDEVTGLAMGMKGEEGPGPGL